MLRIVFWVIVAVLFLSFFGISVQGLFENPTTQSNFDFVLDIVRGGWDTIWGFLSSVALSLESVIESALPS
jgi:hypothetical protein